MSFPIDFAKKTPETEAEELFFYSLKKAEETTPDVIKTAGLCYGCRTGQSNQQACVCLNGVKHKVLFKDGQSTEAVLSVVGKHKITKIYDSALDGEKDDVKNAGKELLTSEAMDRLCTDDTFRSRLLSFYENEIYRKFEINDLRQMTYSANGSLDLGVKDEHNSDIKSELSPNPAKQVPVVDLTDSDQEEDTIHEIPIIDLTDSDQEDTTFNEILDMMYAYRMPQYGPDECPLI